MFGYAIANQEKLSEEEAKRYRAVYCGLCRRLGELHRDRDRLTLTYDLVLLIFVLSDATNTPFAESGGRCAPHPFKTRRYLYNACTDYAADMSVVLAYYKFEDDKTDEGGAANAVKSALFRKEADLVAKKYPEVCARIREALTALSEAEKRNERNPDIPAGIFGTLLGAIFAGYSDQKKEALRAFGESLGRVIYLMDASVDIQSDLKKERYNPLIRTDFASCERLLHLLLADCMRTYRALDPQTDRGIVENVLLSGIWTGYETHKAEEAKKNDQ